MEHFLKYKNNMKSIEQKKLQIAIMENRENQALVAWGKEYYTFEKRVEVINCYINDQDQIWIVNDLTKIHVSWNKARVTHQEIFKFATFDQNIITLEKKYDNSFTNKIHGLIFGGSKNDE